MKRNWLPLTILLTGLLFIFVIPQNNDWVRLLFKIIPMFLIILYAYKQEYVLSINYQRIIIIGLFICMLGDSFIIFSFIFGLAAFLIGHLFYIGAFIKQWKFSLVRFSSLALLLVFGTFFGNEIVSALVNDGATGLVIPVIIYILVISTMGWTAIMTGNKFAILGSLFFIISDSILSWDRFVSPIPFASELIMLTYYCAQFLIAHSVVKK